MWVTQQADHSPTAFKNNNYGIVSKKIALSPCKVRNRPPCDKRCRCLEQQSRDSRDKGAGRNQRRVGRGHIYILAEVKLSSSRRWQQQQRLILVVKYEITLKKQIHWWDWRERANCLPIAFRVYPRPQLPLVQPLVCFLLKGRLQRKQGLLGNFIQGICLEGKFWFFLRSV